MTPDNASDRCARCDHATESQKPEDQIERIASALERISDSIDESLSSLVKTLDRIDGHLELMASVVREDDAGNNDVRLGDVNTYPQD